MESTTSNSVQASRTLLAQRLQLLQLDRAQRQLDKLLMNQNSEVQHGPLPLSFAQERIWFLEETQLSGCAYNVAMAFRLEGRLDEGALKRSFNALVDRHAVLRARFSNVDGVPRQHIASGVEFSIETIELHNLDNPAKCDGELRRHIVDNQDRPIDIRHGCPLRATLVKIAPQAWVLLVAMHHIVVDGWSIGLIVRDLTSFYRTEVLQQSVEIPGLSTEYAAYALWQRELHSEGTWQSQMTYWRDKLANAPPMIQLPTDRPRPPTESVRGATIEFELGALLVDRLKTLAKESTATLFMVFMAAYQLVLARWSGQPDVVVGTPVAGRPFLRLEEIVGLFVNTVAVRTDVSRGLSFRDLIRTVKEATLEAYDNQDLPFDALVRELSLDRSLSRQPIFQAWMALQHFSEAQVILPDLRWTWIPTVGSTTLFDLMLNLVSTADGVRAEFTYATDLFDRSSVQRFANSYLTVLEAIAVQPELGIYDLPLLSADARAELMRLGNIGADRYTFTTTVSELFERQANLTPNSMAVELGEQSLTYGELLARATSLAHELQRRGVEGDVVVGLYGGRSLQTIIGLLAILIAGGAYLPLDPSYPPERLKYMIDHARPHLILTDRGYDLETMKNATMVVSITRGLDPLTDANDTEFGRKRATGESIVYVIYTSGSTGQPKATAMTHRSMVNLIEWHETTLKHPGKFRVLQYAALSFDVAFQEIATTLCGGGTLVLIDEWLRRDPVALNRFMVECRIERLFIPPLMLQSLAEGAISSERPPLRDVITAGEQLRISRDIATYFDGLSECRLHNHYGPTETHVVTALTLPVSAQAWPTIPSIGMPIANTQIYVLDENRRLLPAGIVGEIYIGGVAVARGYFNDPERTNERFVRVCFDGETAVRLYRTGDLGRWNSTGELEYAGRNDTQVKIRGYRVELGEIEATISECVGVSSVAVVAREDVAGGRRLVAYFTPSGSPRTNATLLHSHLAKALPEYMVPSAFVELERLPTTPTGKVDRRALPQPTEECFVKVIYEAPVGAIEEAVTGLWARMLGIERVGRSDNYFRLGGHSFMGMRLISQLNRKFNIELPVIALFQYPTVQLIAGEIEAQMRAVKTSKSASREVVAEGSF